MTGCPLDSVILAAQPQRLRSTLLVICRNIPHAAVLAQAHLLVAQATDDDENGDDSKDESEKTIESDVSEERSSEEAGSSPITNTRTKRKRVTPRYAICENCNDELDGSDNGEEACTWHEGTLRV